MITLKQAFTPQGTIVDHQIPGAEDLTIDCRGLTLLPALIDPHVHLRTPGAEHKENWETGARAAIAGGITTVFDMPNNNPACITHERVLQKRALIDAQLKRADIPLRYGIYFGADKEHLEEMRSAKPFTVALKIFMGSSTGNLVMDDHAAIDRAFKIAGEEDIIVAVHAEDEYLLQQRHKALAHLRHPSAHSEIRCPEAAVIATSQALDLCAKYNTRLYLLHVSTKEEVALIRQAKRNGLPVFAETTPHHLHLTVDDYKKWGTLVQMNPPLRKKEDAEVLWEALQDGAFDSIGTDHAPHSLEEKALGFGKAPSGVPGLETHLPLLLQAYHEGRLTLERIIALTSSNLTKFFNLQENSDVTLVDLKKTRTVEDRLLHTRCGWSPFAGRELTGWPVYTIVQGSVYRVDQGITKLTERDRC